MSHLQFYTASKHQIPCHIWEIGKRDSWNASAGPTAMKWYWVVFTLPERQKSVWSDDPDTQWASFLEHFRALCSWTISRVSVEGFQCLDTKYGVCNLLKFAVNSKIAHGHVNIVTKTHVTGLSDDKQDNIQHTDSWKFLLVPAAHRFGQSVNELNLNRLKWFESLKRFKHSKQLDRREQIKSKHF